MPWFRANFIKIKLVTPIPSLNYLKNVWPLDKYGMLNECLMLKCDERCIPSLHATGFKLNYSKCHHNLQNECRVQVLQVTWKLVTSLRSYKFMRRIYAHNNMTRTKELHKSRVHQPVLYIFKCYKILKLIYLRNWREVQPFAMDMTPSSVTRTHLSC